MSEKKQLKEEQLEKAGGGEIVNPSNKTEEEYEKEEIERQIRVLQEILNGGGQSYKEAMELMNKITELMRQLQGYEKKTIINKN